MKQSVTGSVVIAVPLFMLVLSTLSLWVPAHAFAAVQDAASHFLAVRPSGGRQLATARKGHGHGGKLVYHGGPVITTMKVHAIFWEPKGSFVSPRYNSLILRYFRDVGASGLYHNNTQYRDARGDTPSQARLAGSWVDTGAYPAKRLTDGQMQAEIAHAMKANRWGGGLNNVFFIFTARGENVCTSSNQCSFTSFCASHGVFRGNIVYAAIAYTGTNLHACGVSFSPNGDIDAESAINVASHEQMEVATNPLINAWIDASGAEIGDKCAWDFGGVSILNGHAYLVQKEWDNAANNCVMAGP